MRAFRNHPATPDGRYFVVDGRLWRLSNPNLTEPVRRHWVKVLMAARRDIGKALIAGDKAAEKAARATVHEAKMALGERGPVWWTDGQPDLNRHMVAHTAYKDWFNSLQT